MEISEKIKDFFSKLAKFKKRKGCPSEIEKLFYEIYEIVEKAGDELEWGRYRIRKCVYFGLTPYKMILERPFESIKEAVKAIKDNQLNGSWIMNDMGRVVKRVRIWL